LDWSDSENQKKFRTEVIDYIEKNLPNYYKKLKPPTGLESGDWQNFCSW
jgi:hypothetical protein